MKKNNEKRKEQIVTSAYILYLASIVLPPLALIALTINITRKAELKDTWLQSHFDMQLKTTIRCLIIGLLCFGLVFISVPLGMGILCTSEIYFTYKMALGFRDFYKQQPIQN
jgi:uncharacterized membrane protein